MKTAKAQEALRLLGSDIPDATVEVGVRKDAAFLRIQCGERWSVIWTPGDRWFSVDTDGGFSLNYFDEGLSDDEVLGVLRFQVGVGVAYVRGDLVTTRSSLLRVPELHIEVDGRVAVLTMSLRDTLRNALGIPPRV